MLKNKISIIIFLLISIFIHFILCYNVIKNFSPTYDEPLHLFQGYSYLKTGSLQTVAPYDHPVLAKIISSLGLFFLHPQPVVFTYHPTWENRLRYSFANLMLYYNNSDAEKMLNSGRLVIVFCSLIFLTFYFFILKNSFGLTASFFGIILYIFNNNIIANATLTTQDFLYSVFYFFSLYFFYLWIKEQKFKYSFLTNIFFGLTICTKFSTIILYPTFVIIFSLKLLQSKEFDLKKIINFFAINFLLVVITVLLVYRFKYFTTFFESLIITIKSLQEGRSTFFIGRHSTTGFKEYFLTLFLLKTEIPLLIFIIMKTVFIFFNKTDKEKHFLNVFMLLSVIVYLTIASFSRTQIGIRHLLPIYLIVIYFVSDIVSRKHFLSLIIVLTLWYIKSSFSINPWHISYFNEFCGGAKKGYKYFTDSNIDWGQGLKHLGNWFREVSKENKVAVYFSYFGVGDPSYYGIKYRPIGFVSNLVLDERRGDNILINNPTKVYFAISATNLQATYYKDKNIFNFLKNFSPDKVIAYSIFIYEITKSEVIKNEFINLLQLLNYDEDVEYLKKLNL